MGSKLTWNAAVLLMASVISSGCSHTNLWPSSELPSASQKEDADRDLADRSASKSRRGYGRSAIESTREEDGKLSTARLAEKRGHTERATQIYLELIEEMPDHPLPFHRLGVMAASQGQFEKAHKYFARARKLRPNEPKLLSDVGYTYYMQHRLDESEALLKKALSIKPNYPSAVNNLALVLGEQGRFEESLAMFKKVNDKAEAHSNMAYVYTQMGQLEKAEQEYSKALSLNPNMRSSAEAMIQVASKKKEIKHYQAIAAAKKKTRKKAKSEGLEAEEAESTVAENTLDEESTISPRSMASLKARRRRAVEEDDRAILVSADEVIEEVKEVDSEKPRSAVSLSQAKKSEADSAWEKLARSMRSRSTRPRKKNSEAQPAKLQRPTIQRASGVEAIEEEEFTESEKIQLTGFRDDNAPAPPSQLKSSSSEAPAQSRETQPKDEPRLQDIEYPNTADQLDDGLDNIEALRSSDPSENSVLPTGRLRRADDRRLSLSSPGTKSASRLNQLRIK